MVASHAEIFFKTFCEMFFKTLSKNQIIDWNCEIKLRDVKIPKIESKMDNFGVQDTD